MGLIYCRSDKQMFVLDGVTGFQSYVVSLFSSSR